MLALGLCIAALLVAGALTRLGGGRRSVRPDQELYARRLRDGPDGRR